MYTRVITIYTYTGTYLPIYIIYIYTYYTHTYYTYDIAKTQMFDNVNPETSIANNICIYIYILYTNNTYIRTYAHILLRDSDVRGC